MQDIAEPEVDQIKFLLSQEIESIKQELLTLNLKEARDVRAYLKLMAQNRQPDPLEILNLKLAKANEEKETIIKMLDPDLTEDMIMHKNNARFFSDRRAMYYGILYYRYELQKNDVARWFARDHATIISGLKKLFKLVSTKDEEMMVVWEASKEWIMKKWDFSQKEPKLVDNTKLIKADFGIKEV